MDPARSLLVLLLGYTQLVEPDYVSHNVAEFPRTGFRGGLNYYRAAETYSICPRLEKREDHAASFICGKAMAGALYHLEKSLRNFSFSK